VILILMEMLNQFDFDTEIRSHTHAQMLVLFIASTLPRGRANGVGGGPVGWVKE